MGEEPSNRWISILMELFPKRIYATALQRFVLEVWGFMFKLQKADRYFVGCNLGYSTAVHRASQGANGYRVR